jgi:large subunit ribosomal protein L25
MASAVAKAKARLKPLPDFLKLTRSRDLQNVLAGSNPPVNPSVYETQFPARLLRFFAKYPPPPSAIAARFGLGQPGTAHAPVAATQNAENAAIAMASATAKATAPAASIALSDTNADVIAPADVSSTTPSNLPTTTSSPQSTISECGYANPFLPTKNHVTGKWWSPRFGLRQQADLVKLAAKYDVLDLLPYTKKKPEVKLQRKMEVASGLARGVKGTGVGERVKGKSWERTMKGRLEKRRQAMLGMDALIQEWKQVSAEFEFCGVEWDGIANTCVERTWSGVEEVAEREEGEKLGARAVFLISGRCVCILVLEYGKHVTRQQHGFLDRLGIDMMHSKFSCCAHSVSVLRVTGPQSSVPYPRGLSKCCNSPCPCFGYFGRTYQKSHDPKGNLPFLTRLIHLIINRRLRFPIALPETLSPVRVV